MLQSTYYSNKYKPLVKILNKRWKEHFLVPDHKIRDISGASFAGYTTNSFKVLLHLFPQIHKNNLGTVLPQGLGNVPDSVAGACSKENFVLLWVPVVVL